MASFQLPDYLNPFKLHYHHLRCSLYHPSNILYLLACLSFTFRMFLLPLLIKLDQVDTYLHYDTLFSVAYYNFELNDSTHYLAFSLCSIITFKLHFGLHSKVLWPFYDVLIRLVAPQRITPTCRVAVPLTWKTTSSPLIDRIIEPFEILWRIWTNQMKVHFDSTQRHIFTSLSYETRKKLYLFWQLMELALVPLMLVGIAFCLLSILYFAMPAIQLDCIVITLTLIDLLLTFIAWFCFLKQLYFINAFNLIIVLALIAELKRLKNWFHCRQRLVNGRLVGQLLLRFCQQHAADCQFISRFNATVISPMLYVHINAALLFNIYSVLYLHFYAQQAYVALLMFGLVAAQILVPLGLAVLLIQINGLICCTRNRFYRLRALLQITNLHTSLAELKQILKLAHYYERLNSVHKPAAFSAGIFGEITRKKLIEFALLYFAYTKKVMRSFR